MAEGGPSRKNPKDSSATLEAEVVRHGDSWTQLSDTPLKQAALAVLSAVSPLPHGTYQVTIVLTDDAEMRDLNRNWRGKDAPTNVLSFPAGETFTGPRFLGDIVLAYETTWNEAREKEIALQDHVSHLVIHGMLHLLGFGHAEDAEAERMEDLERTALDSLGIADPYADAQAGRPAEVSP
jgi:probable rRNA maturation factor